MYPLNIQTDRKTNPSRAQVINIAAKGKGKKNQIRLEGPLLYQNDASARSFLECFMTRQTHILVGFCSKCFSFIT